ncbi:unnamed protein product [Lymnaea stagnalis]|uniref:Uncharacterized protein n=1 Tax=Lymnaea stagnalis TaxID=6523 RepID=A0AAV2H0T4_LYMST
MGELLGDSVVRLLLGYNEPEEKLENNLVWSVEIFKLYLLSLATLIALFIVYAQFVMVCLLNAVLPLLPKVILWRPKLVAGKQILPWKSLGLPGHLEEKNTASGYLEDREDDSNELELSSLAGRRKLKRSHKKGDHAYVKRQSVESKLVKRNAKPSHRPSQRDYPETDSTSLTLSHTSVTMSQYHLWKNRPGLPEMNEAGGRLPEMSEAGFGEYSWAENNVNGSSKLSSALFQPHHTLAVQRDPGICDLVKQGPFVECPGICDLDNQGSPTEGPFRISVDEAVVDLLSGDLQLIREKYLAKQTVPFELPSAETFDYPREISLEV